MKKLLMQKLNQILTILLVVTSAALFSCSSGNFDDEIKINSNYSITSGESIQINYNSDVLYDKVSAELIDSKGSSIERYSQQDFNGIYKIRRIINGDISSYENYRLRFNFLSDSDLKIKTIPVKILPSVIVTSLCHTQNCSTISGNVLENTLNTLEIKPFKIHAYKILYEIITPYESFEYLHEFNTPVTYDQLNDLKLKKIPDDVSSYISLINVYVYDNQNNVAKTSLPIKVVRPVEIKHFGKHELAEVYEPVPVTGCIPGAVGNNVQYSESVSETRQNSVSITINKSWSDSSTTSYAQTMGEGITIGETQTTVNTSSVSSSETQSESYADTQIEGQSNNISFNISEGESWSWSLNESTSETEGQSQSQNSGTGLNASTTVGISGEGSLPFLAKASGKVDISAGVSRNWGEANTTNNSETRSENRGYTTNGSSQNGRTYGSVQNDARSHSLSGAYILSSTSTNSITESSSLSSGRVWNMSESFSSGSVVTEGNGESISKTIVDSSSSSTTFSYSGYIPRGRFGIFFRQTSRYVKLSEIITYNTNGFPQHAGFIMMNTWAWAPELSVSNTCEDAMTSSLPRTECLIPPCGE